MLALIFQLFVCLLSCKNSKMGIHIKWPQHSFKGFVSPSGATGSIHTFVKCAAR